MSDVFILAEGGPAPSPSTGILRFSSPTNRGPNNKRVNNLSVPQNMCVRRRHYIGSADQKGLRTDWNNWCMWLGSTDSPGNTLTVVREYIEIPGIGTRQVSHAGQPGRVLANGAFDALSDLISPEAFGLEEFVVGTPYYSRSEVQVPGNGTFMCADTSDTGQDSGHVFDVTVTQCTNLAGTGDLQYSGSVTFTSLHCTPIMLGLFVEGDPLVVLGTGDSILNNVGDTSTGRGNGFFGRALAGSDWATSIAGCNIARPSGNAQGWQGSAPLAALCKYANRLVEEFGTNNFDNTANADPSTVGYVLGLSRNIWTAFANSASTVEGATDIEIIRTKLLPRTNAPTGTTDADQVVYGPKWTSPSGNAIDFNARLALEPLVDRHINFDAAARSTTNPDKWLQGSASSTDGTHPNQVLHISMAATLRDAILA